MLPTDCARSLTSLGTIDRTGDSYRRDPTNYAVLRQVQCYRLFRLLGLERVVNVVTESLSQRELLIAARLKRLPTIVRKLDREPDMCLSRMGDVIGIRIVADSFVCAQEAAKSLSECPWHRRTLDYWANPKVGGYRAAHVLLRSEQEVPGGGNTLRVEFEVQVRSYYQHLWALVSETFGEQVKEGGGPANVKVYLSHLSSAISDWERANPETIQQKLPPLSGNRELVVVRTTPSQKPNTQYFGEDYGRAINQLLSWEEDQSDGAAGTLLLLGLGPIKNLGSTHATFLGMTNIPLPDWMPRFPEL